MSQDFTGHPVVRDYMESRIRIAFPPRMRDSWCDTAGRASRHEVRTEPDPAERVIPPILATGPVSMIGCAG